MILGSVYVNYRNLFLHGLILKSNIPVNVLWTLSNDRGTIGTNDSKLKVTLRYQKKKTSNFDVRQTSTTNLGFRNIDLLLAAHWAICDCPSSLFSAGFILSQPSESESIQEESS